MFIGPFVAIVLLVLAVSILIKRRTERRGGRRPRRRGPGPGAAGAVYELLNEDRRKALEIIVAERAEATDPETVDDIPPEDDDT